MRVTFLNGTTNNELDGFLDLLKNKLDKKDNKVIHIRLRNQDIKYCTGCFGCWVKNPGQCIVPDDSHKVCRWVINSDFTLFVSPIVRGFPTALLKKTMDKLIPLLNPYIELIEGECHHHKRYSKYPKLGVLLQHEDQTDEEDLKIIADIFQRFALNFRSQLHFFGNSRQPAEEVANEIISM